MSMKVQEIIPLDDINKQTLISQVSYDLFSNGLDQINCLVVAIAYVDAMADADDVPDFEVRFAAGVGEAEVSVVGYPDFKVDVLEPDVISKALLKANYVTPSGGIGSRLEELASFRKEAYHLPLASDGVTRRHSMSQFAGSKLSEEAVLALEDTKVTINSRMLALVQKVQAKLGGKDPEGYVVKGCLTMSEFLAYVAEFKADKRSRMGQASCHGPNSQASDRSRALGDFFGVSYTRSQIPMMIDVIMDEVQDMVRDLDVALADLKSMTEVDFIIKHIDGDGAVKKPYSFVKASWSLKDLKAALNDPKADLPYIGMGVGLDAKNSCLQIGALLVGNGKLAAACGFADKLLELDDAYELAIIAIEKAGIMGLSRAGIKDAVMGIYYGQAKEAFTDVAQLKKEGQLELIDVLYPNGVVSDDIAKKFHGAVEKSFGSSLLGLRRMIKNYGKLTKGRTSYFLPDGFRVEMDYKVCLNALGNPMGFEVPTPDVLVQNNSYFYKFINYKVETKAINENDFARNGFVNLIQSIDGLIARLIIVNLKRSGVDSIYSVHDCFRVDVTQMELLEAAIKKAYMDLFGGLFNNSSSDLPLGTDMLQLYFQGANRSLIDAKADSKMVSQFFKDNSKKRRFRKVDGVEIPKLIANLGTTYYFAK